MTDRLIRLGDLLKQMAMDNFTREQVAELSNALVSAWPNRSWFTEHDVTEQAHLLKWSPADSRRAMESAARVARL